MKYWGIVVAVGAGLFFGARMIGHAQPSHAAPVQTEVHALVPIAASDAAGTSAVARHAKVVTLLKQLSTAPAAAPAVAQRPSDIERTAVESAQATRTRRAKVVAEIDERAPNLPQAKREVLLAEADRLAWDKRALRADFMLGKMSESEYVDALEDDIRASLTSFEATLTDDEYTALFNRRRGSDADPFTLESLVGRTPSK